MLRLFWITENMAVGTTPDRDDLEQLRQMGVEGIIDVRSEYCDDEALIRGLGMKFLHIEVDDRYCPTLEQLKAVFKFANPLLDKASKVLIHCQNGYGRSPMVAIALLIERKMPTPQAIDLVERKNPSTTFTPQQEKFIYSLEEKLKIRNLMR